MPLTTRAKELLSWLSGDNRMVPFKSNNFRLIWQRNLRKVGLDGVITFHNTRHKVIKHFTVYPLKF